MRANMTEEELEAMMTKWVRGGVDRKRAVVGVQASEKPGAAPDSPPSRVWVKPVSSPAPSPFFQSFFVPGPLPGANDIIRKHHMVYKRLKCQWGLTIARCILVAKLKRVRHCHVSFVWNELHDRRDPDNVIFGQKFVLDALRDTKIIQDDSRVFILSLTHRVITYAGNPGVFVTIEEVTG